MDQLHNRRILVIDDSLDIQGLLRTFLESKGYSVDCTSNGAEALSLLNSKASLPDIILVDLRMPVMDGLGFLSRQRMNPRLRDIPTVVMTAEWDDESTRLKVKSPASGKSPEVLMKPLSIASVIKAIERTSYLH